MEQEMVRSFSKVTGALFFFQNAANDIIGPDRQIAHSMIQTVQIALEVLISIPVVRKMPGDMQNLQVLEVFAVHG